MEWRKIAGLRDVLAHGYFGLDAETLWDAVSNKLPLAGFSGDRKTVIPLTYAVQDPQHGHGHGHGHEIRGAPPEAPNPGGLDGR